MPKPCLIQKQIEGTLLCHQVSSKIVYQLRTSIGRVVAEYDDMENIKSFMERRASKHGSAVAPVQLYRVTTIVEKI